VKTNVIESKSINDISDILDSYPSEKTLFVTGKRSYKACGAKSIIDSMLNSKDYVTFNDFSVNPKLEDGVKGAKLALEHNIDLIIAIGGGSVIDMAKLIKAFIPSLQSAEEIVRGNQVVKPSGIPFIAIPTTAGSGSEATHFAVAYINKDKFSLASPYLLPEKTILDGRLLRSASSYQRAINGLDALAQAIEGCWAVNSTKESRAMSLQAIKLLASQLPKIISDTKADDLQIVMQAANMAGQVINVTKTTAPHAFTSYHGVPHGHAVWLTLPAIFELHVNASLETSNHTITDPRGQKHLYDVMTAILEALNITADQPKQYLQGFIRKLGVEPNMEVLGASTEQSRGFAASCVNVERLNNNPVLIDNNAIQLIFNLNKKSPAQ